MKKHLIYWLAAFAIVMVGCQKELSFEGSNSPAKGSLQADVTGDCLPKTVNGTYLAGSPLVPATNTISVQVNITKTGTYVVATDTINGYYFRATGTFTTLGATNVILRGNGTPFATGVNNFVVNFDTSFCDIQVTVISPGIGTLSGSPTACAPIFVNGGYSPGVALTTGNNAVVEVNVTTPGIFNIRTDTLLGGSLWFSFSGSLGTTGLQSVTLQAQGSIPAATATGPQTFTVKLGASQCTFVVQVLGPAVFTIDCPNVMVNGTYQVGISLNPLVHTIDIPVTVGTAGAYNISVSVNGMTFSGSGTLAVGPATITLAGSSSSAPAGPAGTYNLSVGTPACSIPIPVATAPVINWSFRIGTTTYQGSTFYDTLYVPAAPFTFFEYEGDNAALDDIIFDFIDLSGGVTTESYDTRSQGLTNMADFYFTDGAGTLDLSADPFDTSVGIIFTVQSHSTATRTITGIFSGTAFDSVSGTIKTITTGTFSVVYPP